MRTVYLVPPNKPTEKSTAFPAMMTNGPTEVRHRNCICQDQEKKNERKSMLSTVGIPDG